MRIIFLLLITLSIWIVVSSQELKLIKVDNKSFPSIKMELTVSENLNIHQLKVIENGKEKLLRIDSTRLYHGVEAICYLIDINKFNNTERQIIYNAFSNVALELNSGTLVNICYIAKSDQSMCFIPASYEFTDRPGQFFEFAKGVSIKCFQSERSSNVDCALTQTIDFIKDKKQLPDKKTIIILSKNIEVENQLNAKLKLGEIKNVRIKMLSNSLDSLVVNSVNFYSLQTELNEKELTDKLAQASKDANLTNIKSYKNYIVEFESSQNNILNDVELHYLDNIIKTSFIKPYEEKASRVIWIYGVILILIIIILFQIKKQINQKRKMLSLKETVSLLFDKKMKILSTQTQTPVLEIKIQNNISNYHIKKLNTTIGRKKDCDIIIEDLTISSHHASITNEGGEFYIQDHESTNGVFVNDIKVSKKVIKNGDIVRLGKAMLTIHY